MTTMLEAMRKAGLVSSAKAKATEKERECWHKQKNDRWKANATINRFGDIATFEIWNKAGRTPGNYLKRCALCGKRPYDSI